MSATLYDKAFLTKLQKWVRDPNIKITGPNETKRLFAYNADINNDKPLELPLITLRRDPTIQLLNVSKKPTTFDGYRDIAETGMDGIDRVNQINMVPIQINYQIDIYTRYEEEAEEYLRDFVFNLINYPKLEIEIPYNNSKRTAVCNLRLNPELQDNSDIPERLVPGQFTRKTIHVYIDDAHYYNYRTKEAWKIDNNIQVETKLSTDLDVKIKDVKLRR